MGSRQTEQERGKLGLEKQDWLGACLLQKDLQMIDIISTKLKLNDQKCTRNYNTIQIIFFKEIITFTSKDALNLSKVTEKLNKTFISNKRCSF